MANCSCTAPPPPPPSPAPPPPFPPTSWNEISTTSADFFTLACYGVFSLLIGFDVWRAFSKRATWLPGKAFVLSGVTVQIIVWYTGLSNIILNYDKEVEALIYLHQLVVSGRVAVCVFIGYLLPRMGAPSARTFVALAITISTQITTELLILLKGRQAIRHDLIEHPNYYWKKETLTTITWSTSVNLILFICIVVLGLILGCTILASKTIHGLLRERISAIFSITQENEFQDSNERTMPISWNDFEDEVLRSWFVARACQVDYVISRSVLSSAVGIVVTICVTLAVLSNTYFNEFISYGIDAIYSLLFSFILIGWVAICWRWLAAQLYFRPYKHSWRKRVCVEDFWTSNTADLIHMYDLKRDRRVQDDESSCSKLQRLPTKIFTRIRLHKLLYLVLMLQVTVVFFSKLCGLLSEVILGKFVYWCRKHMKKRDPVALPEKFARILQCICMPGESPSDLWEANEMSFNKVKLLMQKSCKKGMQIKENNSVFNLYSLEWAEAGTELLNMLKKRALPSVLKHFPRVEKQCVKMTVVSLITILIRLHKAKSDRLTEVLRACHEVWDLLSFVDECDIDLQANQISLLDDLNRDKNQVFMAADKEFYKLQMEYDKISSGCEEARRFLEDLLEKCEGLLKTENLLGDCKEKEEAIADLSDSQDCKEEVAADLSDSKDWMKIAPSYTLYKLCKLMLDEDVDIKDFVVWTEESLRNVIACCVSRLPDMLVKQCWKWAQEFEEDKLWEAIHLTGKCRGMIEAWKLKPKWTLNNTKQWTIQVEESLVVDL